MRKDLDIMERNHAHHFTRSATRAQARLAAAARGERGMTLMEIMIVLAILALVMGFLVGPKVINMFKSGQSDVAKLMAKDYVAAYGIWTARTGEECPSSLADLKPYRNKKDDKDPWKSEFVMHCGANAPENTSFGVASPGPDRKEGTPDDIKSWDD